MGKNEENMNMKLKVLDAVRESLSLPNEKCFARNYEKKK